ncbi:hypothetical protein [Terrabacter terrigena]|uniref:DoxX family protein n=1 Tax=Terrabacter terrigena TaxID=574718 RepID=A0ABW3MZD1_9MICO
MFSKPTNFMLHADRARVRHTAPPVSLGVPRVGPAVGLSALVRDVEGRAVAALDPLVVPLLRGVLGVLFVWFGLLKVMNQSPVGPLVAATLPWAPPSVVVPVLGAAEVLLGAGLVTGIMLRVVLPVMVLHLGGTFMTFVMVPNLLFRQADPLLLTQTGEFVVKNLVLISAALVLMVHTRRGPADRSPGRAPRSAGA